MPSRFEISDELWAEIAPLIPPRQRRHRHPGRKPIEDRLALNGILHVLHTGIAWEDLPREYGYGSGVTCWPAAADLAAGRGVGHAASATASQAQRRGQDQLVSGRC